VSSSAKPGASDTFHFEPYLCYIKLRIVLGWPMSSADVGFLKTPSPKPIFLKEKVSL